MRHPNSRAIDDTRTPSRAIVALDEITNTCFVAMPFALDFRSEYDKVIRPAIESAGLKAVRGDEVYTRQSVLADVWLGIRKSLAVVAELTGRNQNVMYEVGLAHAIGKPIILLTRDEDDVPFNLRALRRTFYKVNEPDWGTYLQEEISGKLRTIVDNPSLRVYLEGVEVEESLPDAPTAPLTPEAPSEADEDLSGVWHATWPSVSRQIKQDAVLVIPSEHGPSFTASLTVSYSLEGQQTVVQETLSSSMVGQELTLTGVAYTYVQQGASRQYGLDNFSLEVDADSKLVGKIFTRNGERSVTFVRSSTRAIAPGKK
jgi:hypothetical protein